MPEAQREALARKLYVASGGSEKDFPWPCKGADRYRKLANVAISFLNDERPHRSEA